MRLTRLLALAVPLVLACSAAPAGAQTWVPNLTLSAPGAGWVREYSTSITQPGVMYASTEGGGVWRSGNNGLTWAANNDGLKDVPDAMNVRTVMLSGTSTAYAGTSVGLFKSVGGGAWQPVAQGPEPDPGKATKLNKAVQTLYSPLVGKLLAGVASGGVYSSSDDGATWQPPAPGNGMAASETVWSIGSLIPGVLFAATGSGVYRSLNNGATWTLASDGITGTILRVFADEKRPTTFYASGSDGVFRTINGGITWSNVEGPVGHQLGGGQVRALIQVSGVNETRLYAGTQNGVYAGTTGNGLLPGPVRWRHVDNAGLGNNTIIWTLKSFLTTPGVLWAGTQSNGGYMLTFFPPVNATKPVISGTAQVAKTLSTTDGTWNGTKTIEFEYQWQRCTNVASPVCTNIPDATNSTYTATNADKTFKLRVVVTASNDVPTFGLVTATSDFSGVVAPAAGSIAGANQAQAPTITISGQPQPGKVITANQPLFNPAATTWVYQWELCDENGNSCDPIQGGNTKAYLIRDEDVGGRLCPYVTGSNADGGTTTDCAVKSSLVLAPDPVQTAPTAIGGDAYVGGTLVSGVGGWAYPGTTFTRQWESCEADGSSCATISGAKSATYIVKADDKGHRLRVRINADSNGPNQLPAPKEVFTPLSAVITDPPAPPVDPTPQPTATATPAPDPQPSSPPAPQPDLAAPVISSLKAVSAKLKPGAQLKLSVGVNESGTLDVEVQRGRAGRKSGKTCKPGAKKGKKCTVFSKVASYKLPVGGSQTVALPKRKLAAGDYRAVVTPVDAAGNRGAAKTISFKVLKK